MKNLLKSLGIFICLFFISPFMVNAAIDTNKGLDCEDEVELSDGIISKTCTMNFTVSGVNADYNAFDITLTLTNMVVHSYKLEPGYKLISNNGTVLKFESTKANFPVGTYKVGTITFYKVRSADECGVKYHYDFRKVSRSCIYQDDLYYDKKGNIVSELQFKRTCEEHKCDILEGDDTSYYFDDNGTEVSKETYEEKCLEHHYCEKVENTYYDKDGEETTEEDYTRYCLPHYCEVVNGVYFNKSGKEVNKLTYEKECLTHSCEILEDGTSYGKNGSVVNDLTYEKECKKNVCRIFPDGTHFDKSGNITDALSYRKECETIKCEVLTDGTIYGVNGDIVDNLTYRKECETIKCEILPDGTIYGINGDIVDNLTYRKECETVKCEILPDGTIYGIDGSVVDSITYKQQCEINKCIKVGDLYYDNNGNEVSESDYNKLCGTIENPKTGYTLPVALLSLTLVAGIVVLVKVKKYNKFM